MTEFDRAEAAERFMWFVTNNYGDIARFIHRFELNQSQIYRIAKGTSIPKFDYVVMISVRTGISLQWWGTGKGNWWAQNEAGIQLAVKQGLITEEEAVNVKDFVERDPGIELLPLRVVSTQSLMEELHNRIEELENERRDSNE